MYDERRACDPLRFYELVAAYEQEGNWIQIMRIVERFPLEVLETLNELRKRQDHEGATVRQFLAGAGGAIYRRLQDCKARSVRQGTAGKAP